MNSFFDKLNLRPQERRWVMFVMVVVIVILNWAFVWPYFSDWAKVKAKMNSTQKDLTTYNSEILMDESTNGYKAQLAQLEQVGDTPKLEGDIQLYKAIMAQAQGKINISDYSPIRIHDTHTNDFYVEQAMKITVNSNEKELVDFIFGIGGDSSMIRVRELDLHPADANRYGLRGTITLSANYQKPEARAAAKPAASQPLLTTGPKTTNAVSSKAGQNPAKQK